MTSVGYRMERKKPLAAQSGIAAAPPTTPAMYSTAESEPKTPMLLRTPSLSTSGESTRRPSITPPKNTAR